MYFCNETSNVCDNNYTTSVFTILVTITLNKNQVRSMKVAANVRVQ